MALLRPVIKDNQLQEVPDAEVDFEHLSPNQHLGTHANLVPLQSAVSSGRVFYGARFANQALPLKHPEAPLVQLSSDLDPAGRSFDEILGDEAGNVRATHEGKVHKVEPDQIVVKTKDGKEVVHDTYNNHPFNRKTSLTNIPTVEVGDSVKPGQMLAHSNYTTPEGALAMGTNARVGIVPYKGHTMDDAIAISEAFAKRLTANNLYGHDLSYKRGVKGGKAHYTGLFTHKFVNDQLNKLDDDGVVKVGQVLNPGDPIILATKPRVISSTSAQLGQLSKHMKNARNDASVLWDKDTPGTVLDVHRTRSGVKVNVSSDAPAEVGDKITMRSGAKAVISTILPDEHMPRTTDGKPLEVLLNPQSLVSRMNPSLAYEIMLGKVARKTGKNYKLPSVLPKGQAWYDFVKGELDKNGLKDKEEVFDPLLNKKLENPVTVGDAFIMKLHHTSSSKVSSRGTGAYSCYDAQTEVLTKKGWKPWPSITTTDELATLLDGKMVFQKPEQLHSYDYAGELIGFEGRYLDWLVTPNHKHFVKFLRPDSKWRFETAERLYTCKFYVKQFGMSYEGHNPENFELAPRTVLVENCTDRATRHYRQAYVGKVYCATMRTGLLYVRRNGKPFLSGNSDNQPLHGGSEFGQSKRLSGLDSNALMSSGAYNLLREGATLRGTRSDQYWRELRQGYEPKEPGTPFIWEKFKALLQGAGYHARKLGKGKERLQFLTDKDLAAHRPIKVKTGDLVNMDDLSPIRGGLFDPSLTGSNSWGAIDLPHTIPSPAAQDVICKLLGITEKKYRAVLAGEEPLETED